MNMLLSLAARETDMYAVVSHSLIAGNATKDCWTFDSVPLLFRHSYQKLPPESGAHLTLISWGQVLSMTCTHLSNVQWSIVEP